MNSEKRQRASRWNDAPVLDRLGNPRAACLTERDIEGIFKPLTRYRYLSANYIHAFAGGSLDYLVNRLSLLSRQPNNYLARPHQQRANAAANHCRLIYELADKGRHIMHDRGASIRRSRASANFAHELMTCSVMSSIELGTHRPDISLITWSDILASSSLPERTRHSPKPFAIPVSINGQAKCIEADGQPFGIARRLADRIVYFFCPGIEADCGTEPIATSDFQRSSLYRKFTLYLAIEAQQTYRSHFGFPNLYVPFVTTNKARLASMMALLDRITAGAGSRSILFKTFPAFTSPQHLPAPSGHMLTEDWQRVGYPPFNFLRS